MGVIMAKKQSKIEYINTSDLIPYCNNSRVHSEEQINQVAASIKEFGFTNAVLIDEDNGIIAGHCRVMAANKLKITKIPTVRLDYLTEAQKKAYIIADNKIATNSTWDDDLLKVELEALNDLDFDLSLTGFSDDELDLILDDLEVKDGLTDEDHVPDVEENKTPVTKLGDVWTLGNHRLMCGDSTNIDDVDKLLNGEAIDLIHTDPPYGINEKGDRTNRNGKNSLRQGVSYKDFDDSSINAAIDAFNLCQSLKIPRQVWWGANYYAHTVPQSNNWFVWDKRVEDKQKDLNSDCELAWVKSKLSSIRIFRHLWKGLIKGSEHGQAKVHPTQKPIALVEWVFDYFKKINTVLDLFGGSGSTLIASEKRGITALVMELEPHYCDVIIKRWQEYTGKNAYLESNGKLYREMESNNG